MSSLALTAVAVEAPRSAAARTGRRKIARALEILPLDAPFGAEVRGLDLARPLADADFRLIHAAALAHHVLVFRDQRTGPAEQIAFSRRFGPLQVHVLRNYQLPAHPEVLVVSNIRDDDGRPQGLGDAGEFWHSDLSYKERPSLGSLLHAQELPAEGGDTLFADQHAAYDALPAELKTRLDGLRAEHSYLLRYEELRARNPWRPQLSAAQIAEVAPVVHPVVRTHPETGRKALFVSEHFTSSVLGLPPQESGELLRHLFEHSVKPEFVYRHRWQPGDMVFWDNRSVQHRAAGTPAHQRRRMHRTTIEGDLPV